MKNKHFVLSALVLLFLSFGFINNSPNSYYNNPSSYYNSSVFLNNPSLIPDVMGYVNVIENDGIYTHNEIFNIDSFPNFSGFPKSLTGTTFEGGILCNMDNDQDLELVYNIGFTVQAWNYDGSNVPGWPQTVASYALEGAPSFGDIDGDGQEEIVVSNHGLTSGGFIYAFRKNGTTVPGFPINHGYSARTPVLANVDNTGGLEIIVNLRQSGAGQVWIYKGDASVLSGWPKTINHVPASSAAVGDITGDAFPEIVMESYSSLYAWDKDGNLLAGFPYTMPNGDVNSYSSPVLADVDSDNIREIVFGTHSTSGGNGYVYLMKNNGTVMSGWPKTTGQWVYGPAAVGYIDGDNVIDIAVGDQVASGSPLDFIYAWNKNGTALAGFPVGPLWAINDQVIIGDIDNDNSMELICDDNTTSLNRGKYLAFNHDGTPAAGWPIETDGTTFFSTPVVGDINRDGILDIAGSGRISSTNTTAFYLWNTGTTYNPLKIVNPMWQYNSRHNGVYGDNPLVGIQPVSGLVPGEFNLYQNYPNPFNPATKIRFDIPSGNYSNVTLTIYNALGEKVSVLIDEQLNSGSYEVSWNGASFSSGVYFYRVTAGEFTMVKKMMLIK